MLPSGSHADSPVLANDTNDVTERDSLRWRLLVLLPPTIALIVLCWMGLPIWLQAAAVAWIAYFFFCAASLFHEFTHRHDLLRCRIWARLIGTLILVPATVYRETHLRHHAYLNRPLDWELWPYSDPHCSRRFRQVFAWIDLLAGYVTAPFLYGRIFWHHRSPLSAAARRTIAWEYAAAVAFWTAALTAIAVFNQWNGFLRAWVLPWWLAGMLQTGRKFTEHLGLSSFDPLYGARTVFGTGPLTRICSYLNSDIFIHGPHHRTPRVTADELHAFAAELQRCDGAALPFYSTYAAAAWDMLPHLLRNPGVGENAEISRGTRSDPAECAAPS